MGLRTHTGLAHGMDRYEEPRPSGLIVWIVGTWLFIGAIVALAIWL